MSRMATKPSVERTWSPSATRRQKRQFGSGGNGHHSLVGHAHRTRPHHLADRAVYKPRRVVVGVAATRLVEQDDVLASEATLPARAARRVGGSAKPRAPVLLHRRRDELRRDVVDLDRRESQPLEAVDRACPADETGERQPLL